VSAVRERFSRAPVDTAVTSGSGVLSVSMPVPFTVVAGANTRLNVLYDTNQGFGLWDISVVTGVPDTYKIVPNDMTILATTQGRRFRYRRAAGAGGRRARPLASHDV